MAVVKQEGRKSDAQGPSPLRDEELENYGVWVKSEPQDLPLDDVEGAGRNSSEPGSPAFAPDIPDIHEESFLTEEEESLLVADGKGPDTIDFSMDELGPSRVADEEEFSIPDEPVFMDEDEPLASTGSAPVAASESPSFDEAFSIDEGISIENVEDLPQFADESPAGEAFELPPESSASSEPLMKLDDAVSIEIPDLADERSEMESIDSGGLPDMDEMIEETEEIDLPSPTKAAAMEEEISLDSFGVQMDETPPKTSRASAAPGASEEVSLDDFLDSADFGLSEQADEAAKEALSQAPIDLDLEFEDDAEFETLSVSPESEDDFEAARRPQVESELDEPKPYEGPPIEAESVSEFDDFLNDENLALGPTARATADQGMTGAGLAVDENLIESGMIEETAIEDQTSLVTEADSDFVGIDMEMGGPSASMIDEAGSRKPTFADEETDEILSSISDIGGESAPRRSVRAPAEAVEPIVPIAPIAPEQAATAMDFTETIPYDGTDLGPEEDLLGFGDGIGIGGDSRDFDDVAAVERVLGEEEGEVANQRGEDGGVQASLLHKIADELENIKQELSSLKGELSAMRKGGVEGQAEQAAQDDRKVSGFFDEEEDETIALTGDELDNILNTADFTEETGASEAAEFGSNVVLEEPDLSDIIPLDEAPQAKAPASASVPAPKVEDRGESELNQIAEEGLTPMTEAPEDTSYLEEPLKDGLEDAVIEDTPLEEPDLSDFVIDESLEEEVSVIDGGDQSVEIPGSLEEDGELELDDITLDLNPDESFVPEAEAETEAPVAAEPAALEDDFVSEISLADETMPEEPPAPYRETNIKTQDDMNLDEDLFVAKKEAAPKKSPPVQAAPVQAAPAKAASGIPEQGMPQAIKTDIKNVLQYMDRLLESLPEEKIEEFARSEHFGVYKRLFEELGLV